MAIESLSSDFKFNSNLKFFLVGFIYFSVAMFLSIYTFYKYAGIVSVILCSFAAFPYFYKKIKSEELYDEKVNSEKKRLKKHYKLIKIFLVFFLGVLIASTFWSMILPASQSDEVFKIQSLEILEINDRAYITGDAVHESSTKITKDEVVATNGSPNVLTKVGAWGDFKNILANNLSVMIACILFSFIYGSGAIFLLTWNASVVGVAIAMIIRDGLLGGLGFLAYIYGLSRYVIHGVPEITGFVVAGLAGGIISVAVLRNNLFTKKGESVIIDAVDLILISIGLIVFAAVLEVWVTPLVFG